MTKTLAGELIKDGQSLVGAKSRFDHSIPVYDDGFGPLFISRDSMRIVGIVRAQSWEDAYSICEDEFFPEATESHEDFVKEYGEAYTEDACWQEAFGFRPNGPNKVGQAGIYAKDLNGDCLDLLTPKLLAELEVTLEIEDEDANLRPGAGNLDNPTEDGPKTFAFGHEWFEGGRAPYTVYRVVDGSVVEPE